MSIEIRELIEVLYNTEKNGTHAHSGLKLRVATRDILPRLDSLVDAPVYAHPVRTSEHCTGTEEREGIVFRASVVDCNIPQHILVDFLGEVNVDAKEIS